MGFSVPAAIASRRIRERWHAEDNIRFLAMHDSLTGLPNRVQFNQHLERAVARAKRHGNLLAVFCLDLDRFKDVNDTLGHATGDSLLEEVAARLKENVRDVDLVGRLGGDEFAIVAEELDTPEDAMRLAPRVCSPKTNRATRHSTGPSSLSRSGSRRDRIDRRGRSRNRTPAPGCRPPSVPRRSRSGFPSRSHSRRGRHPSCRAW
jgi:diguanylate cyclase (GGDEF)-like protein